MRDATSQSTLRLLCTAACPRQGVQRLSASLLVPVLVPPRPRLKRRRQSQSRSKPMPRSVNRTKRPTKTREQTMTVHSHPQRGRWAKTATSPSACFWCRVPPMRQARLPGLTSKTWTRLPTSYLRLRPVPRREVARRRGAQAQARTGAGASRSRRYPLPWSSAALSWFGYLGRCGSLRRRCRQRQRKQAVPDRIGTE